MEGFKNGNVSHGFSKGELICFVMVILLVLFFLFPKARGAFSKIKLNSIIDSVYSYKESVNNYYVSQLLYDNSFKLNGVYTISEGNLVYGESTYNILMGGNVPNGGYLNYVDNSLKSGCINIKGYSVLIEDGDIIDTKKGSCDVASEVALGM